MGKPDAWKWQTPSGGGWTAHVSLDRQPDSVAHMQRPLFDIDDDTREALKLAIHAMMHNADIAKYRAGDSDTSDASVLRAYAERQTKAAVTLVRLLSEEA